MYTLMRDPVTLPSSKVVIDRSTIKAHLLSDTKDPFNRSPLSIDDVVPGEPYSNSLDFRRMLIYHIQQERFKEQKKQKKIAKTAWLRT